MTEKKISKENSAKQPITTDIIPDRFTYNTEQIEEFLKVVFHADRPDEGNILTWFAPSAAPRYPMDVPSLMKRLERGGTAAKLYFGTSATITDPDENRLYNRKSLFCSFHVLVLDDIGTKVPFDKIPASFDPTYKIESSKGNWQYGYVLEEPLLVEEQATALVQLAYDAGLSDAGGKMATKLVRLPDGINGKVGNGQNFRVNLADMDGPYWTPEAILDEIDCGVAWKDVVADTDAVMKTRAASTVGTSVWSPIKATMPSLSGTVDPALEWLYSQNMVKQEVGDWVTILCPQCDSHSDGELSAGYSPMGWGSPPYKNSRIFHCFHEHCKDYNNRDFLQYIADNGGPELPVTERAADLVKRYAYNGQLDGVYDIMSSKPYFIPMRGFANLHPETTMSHKYGEKKPKLIKETALFITSKARLTVRRTTYDPTTPARIIQTEEGNLLNTYIPPTWGDGDYDQDDVDKFNAYIKYLVPNAADREFFLDWLAAKSQSMAFRGPAILMIATQQGAGRTTLGNMLMHMFGTSNVVKKPFADIIKVQTFNDWMAKALVITDETLATEDGSKFWVAAERLKERVDTTPAMMQIEQKNRDAYSQMNYSSFLLFSNHAGAMRLGENDRRFYVINNPEIPAPAEYFTALNQWIEDGTWAKGVYRWLRQREVNVPELLKPPVMTEAKRQMIDTTTQPLEVAVEAILWAWPSLLITQNNVTHILNKAGMGARLGMDANKMRYALPKVFRERVMRLNIADGEAIRFAVPGLANGLTHWVPRCKATPDVLTRMVDNPADRDDIDIERAKFPENDTDVISAMITALDERDF